MASAAPDLWTRPSSTRPRYTPSNDGGARKSGGLAIAEPIFVVNYDPAWPAQFAALRDRLARALAPLAIEHVGSTAVPGLAAKPVIDLDVVIPSQADLPAAISRLTALGYAYEGENGVPDRHAFRWPPGESRHHLYVCPAGSAELRRHLALRDYLRARPAAAQAYADLKRAAAVTHRDAREAYTAAKSALIERFLAEALAGNTKER